jgi:hypothetical protein
MKPNHWLERTAVFVIRWAAAAQPERYAAPPRQACSCRRTVLHCLT